MSTRFLLTAALVAALAGTGSLTAADAAPKVSPFAGTYTGYPPGTAAGFAWTLTVSDSGHVSGAVYFNFGYWYESGKLSGRVDDSGQMSCRGDWTFTTYSPDGGSHTTGGSIRFKAAVALDGAGNLLGTADDGTTFTWTRE